MATLDFPDKTLELMRKIGVSEADVQDTYNTGEHFPTSTGSHMAVKKYPSFGYELKLLYVVDHYTGRPVPTWVKKRPLV